MSKIFLVLCLVVAVAKGEIKDVTSYSLNAERTEDYIKANRLQYAQVLQEFDSRLDRFKEYYTGRLKTLEVTGEMLANNVIETEERLNPLELLSDFSNQCVVKYRKIIPTVASTKTSITNCIIEASTQLTTLVTNPTNHRNNVQNYYTNYFEKEIANCATKFPKTPSNYTSCITTVTTTTNANTIINQKTFSNLMDLAECTATANIKKALDCTYTIQTRTNSQITEANVLINNCLLGKDESKPCPAACAQNMTLTVSYQNATIPNPFYGQQSHNGCLLLNLI